MKINFARYKPETDFHLYPCCHLEFWRESRLQIFSLLRKELAFNRKRCSPDGPAFLQVPKAGSAQTGNEGAWCGKCPYFPMMHIGHRTNNKMAARAKKRLAVISDHLNSCRLHSVLPEISFTDAKELDTERVVLQNDLLTQEQVDFYNTNGYLVVRNLVPQELLDKYRDRFTQICNGVVKVPGITVMRDVTYAKANRSRGERTVNKLQNFEQDEVLFSYCELPQILKYVACFAGPDIKSVHTMLINKPPDPGTLTSRHPLHQDLHYFPFRPANRMVCSWTAMEKVDKKNGCLVVIPGTHYTPLLPHHYPNWEVSQAAQFFFLRLPPLPYLKAWIQHYERIHGGLIP